MIPSLLFTLIFITNVSFGICGTIPSKNEPALLVVSYDAFRPDYLNRNVTPNLNKFREDGVSAPFMMNVFPTITFVNHFSIATGLYAEHHGVMANKFYDLKLKKQLSYGYEMFHYSNKTEPIWITNEKAGKHSGCMMWPGSDFMYNGKNCTFTGIYNETGDWEDRVDTAISWFTHPKTPANLVMLYVDQPDLFGHAYGHESPVITNMVAKLDSLTGYIQEKLIKNGLDKHVNVIHLADHGMNSVSLPYSINLMNYVANNSCKMYGQSPLLQIVPNDPTKENEIFANLTKAANQNGHFKVYNHKNVPARWHANNPIRMGPIFAVADVGYAFQDLVDTAKYYKDKFNISISDETKYGIHGYDNEEPSMRPIFMAKGPMFAKHKQLEAVNMIDLYNLFCLILDIKGSTNDGSSKTDSWNDLFVKMPQQKGEGVLWAKWALVFIVSLAVIVFILKVRYLRQQHANDRHRENSLCILKDFEIKDDEYLSM